MAERRRDPRRQEPRRHVNDRQVVLEGGLPIGTREMERLIFGNHYVNVNNTALIRRELSMAKDEIARLEHIIPQIRAEKDAQIRDLTEKVFKLEDEVCASEALKVEVLQLRNEVQTLKAVRHGMAGQVQALTSDVIRLQAENKELTALRAQLDGMKVELIEARTLYECERKAREGLVAQNQAMEKDLLSMSHDIQRLNAEKLNAQRRAAGLGGGAYGMANANAQVWYPGGVSGSGYVGQGPHNNHGPQR